MTEEIRMHDVVQMKKKHPCGSYEWMVIRIGADIKMRCLGCERVVMLDRAEFLRRRKKVLEQGPVPAHVTLGLPDFESKENQDDGQE